jgi:hypothetical protein
MRVTTTRRGLRRRVDALLDGAMIALIVLAGAIDGGWRHTAVAVALGLVVVVILARILFGRSR